MPSVSVPVLSNTTDWMREASSRLVACLNRIPCFAPMSVATMIAVGVARPSASGHAMTIAVTASVSAKSSPCCAIANQYRNVMRPAPTATMTR